MPKPMRRREVVRALLAAGCTELRDTGRHTVYGCPCGKHLGPVPRHNEITAGVVGSLNKATRLPARGMASVTSYSATARREGRFWVVDVDGIGVTQGRSVAEARDMAADLVVAIEDVDPAEVTVEIAFDLPDDLEARITAARAEVARAEETQRQAAERMRTTVRDLRDRLAVTGRDLADIVGLSPQRVSQLLTAVVASVGQSDYVVEGSGRGRTAPTQRTTIQKGTAVKRTLPKKTASTSTKSSSSPKTTAMKTTAKNGGRKGGPTKAAATKAAKAAQAKKTAESTARSS